MVGRLVEDQKIHTPQDQLAKRQPCPLPTRKIMHALGHVIGIKEEACQRRAELGVRHGGVAGRQLLKHGVLLGKAAVFLVIVADLDVIAEIDPPCGAIQKPAQKA